MNVIETHALSKTYGSTTIPGGHVVALVGPNGAGKSTLLNIVTASATSPTRKFPHRAATSESGSASKPARAAISTRTTRSSRRPRRPARCCGRSAPRPQATQRAEPVDAHPW
jgi:ABC-type branched-subunit amino acid transport system ATPase component